jgi:hypothetical protein
MLLYLAGPRRRSGSSMRPSRAGRNEAALTSPMPHRLSVELAHVVAGAARA